MLRKVSGTSLLARWDPRYKIAALLALAFSFSAVSRIQTIPYMLGLLVVFWLLSGVPLAILGRRLRYPSLFIALVILMLLFAGRGDVLLTVGFLTITDSGLNRALLVAARFYSILILAMLFFAGTPLLTTIRALQALGMPYIITDMALLMARYVEVLHQDLRNLHRCMHLRGFRLRGWSLTSLQGVALMVANLLLRSFEQSQRVYLAMRLRGYGQADGLTPPLTATPAEGLFFVIVVGIALGLGWLG